MKGIPGEKQEPRVSIGLPVYNGEKYLKETIDSIRAQTFKDFELIISDNASTDRTSEICQAYSVKDPRIRYYRSQKNIGAALNFNRVFELSEGEYFKWAAHDDILSSDFLEKCVEVLDRDHSAVLCYPRAKIIDEHGKIIEECETYQNADSPKPHERFRNLIRDHRCYEVFGLIRAGALRNTRLIGNYAHGDGVLLARLGLLGRIREIPEYLFFPRKHPEQSMNLFGCYANKMPDYHSYSIWFDPAKKGKIFLPHWIILGKYCGAIVDAPITLYEKLYCYIYIINWIRRWRRYLALDLKIAVKKAIASR